MATLAALSIDAQKDAPIDAIARKQLVKYEVAESVVKVPAGVDTVVLKIPRDNWPNAGAKTITVETDYSEDGQKWRFLSGFTADGGSVSLAYKDAKGNSQSLPLTEHEEVVHIGASKRDGRMVRVRVTAGEVLTAKVELTATERGK